MNEEKFLEGHSMRGLKVGYNHNNATLEAS